MYVYGGYTGGGKAYYMGKVKEHYIRYKEQEAENLAVKAAWEREVDRYRTKIESMGIEQVANQMQNVEQWFGSVPSSTKKELEIFWTKVYTALEQRKYELENTEDVEVID